MDNIFKHTSRSYFDIYNALVAAYPRKPTWLFKEMAALFDFDSELMNRIATDILYPKTRESAYSFAARCDYAPVEADGATDTLTITLTSAMAKMLPVGYQVGGISLGTGGMVMFETTAVGNSSGTDTITVACKQTKTYTDIAIGVIDNSEDFADYPIDGYNNIIRSGFILYVNAVPWTLVNNFDDSLPGDTHFTLIYQSQGRVRVGFGDGVTGKKPSINSSLSATFKRTDGLLGVMGAGEININIGGDSNISAITNAGTSGGNNSESVASIIRNARANVRLRSIVWSKEDLEIAARKVSGVQKALGIPGSGVASIHIIPVNGGVPSGDLLNDVGTYVTSLTQFGGMPVTAFAPNYLPQNIVAEITVRTGYVFATVGPLVEFALTMVVLEYDNQIMEYYDDYGIDKCRIDVINVLFGWAFPDTDNEALEFIIEKWKGLLGDKPYREWGQSLEIGDLWIMGNSLIDFGVDIFTLTSPLANVHPGSEEIISLGTVVVTET